MSNPLPGSDALSPSLLQRHDEICDRFERAWIAGERPLIENYLEDVAELERPLLLRELLRLDLAYRRRGGETIVLEDYLRRFAEQAALIQAEFEEEANASVGSVETGPEERMAAPITQEPVLQPQRIGRYRVDQVLGEGSFGIVYLAYDDQLQRLDAIKVPHARLVAQAADAEAYLTEARTVANLDHPHIVPVFDVGSTEQCPCFVVSKYIDGTDLAKRLKHSRMPLNEAVELVATVAEALHYAHKQGIVHRDIKPGNILLDKGGKPFVGDFGLALREQDVGKGPRYAGTPAYMSPEQARGEGHRVDGRSDIFSLGVVFYELLVGRKPFHADSRQELLEQITSMEVRPPRQWDDTISKELERICLKALSKRASERYTTARDMADDLRHFLAHAPEAEKSTITVPPRSDLPATPTAAPTPSTPPASASQPLKIVPKGLRSFDAHDADFFLELLPGPRDREGLPDSLRFWKTRIEETDPDNTFAVGLIYGPSGCGKSSLVKAGLLPRLSNDVIAVYVEATAQETENRLLNGLRRRFPDLSANLGLKETLAALRRGQGVPVGKKVLMVLDQFEQWLHAKKDEENTELVQALRHCDGGRVQCIVMVRDDFWMAATRFMRELEFDLVPDRNTAATDLFDLRHAKKVLTAFGRALGTLPEHSGKLNNEQKAFVEQAVSALAQEGKVICVRLALFAEMMKGKTWTPGALKEVGGIEGVGVTFLEETFSSETANPKHRLHQKAARAVLKDLLPESGTDIKGHMRSHAELLQASGYASRPRDFDDLIHILDSETRLITPTDPEGKEGADESPFQAQPGEKYYQLTHDYLVHSLRDWLTRKQKETKRGRAELRLAERAALWNAKPENRLLPAWWEWANIRLFTHTANWTLPQRKMMRKAGRFHVLRATTLLLVVLLLGWGGWEVYGSMRAQSLVDSITTAETADVPRLVKQLDSYRRWADSRLLRHAQEAPDDSKEHLNASLALVPVDDSQVEYLYQRLLQSGPGDLPVIRDALAGWRDALAGRLWDVLGDAKADPDQRFRAACALAAFAPDDPRWDKARDDVAGKLAAQEPFEIARWAEVLKPMRKTLLPPLAAFLEDEKRTPTERRLIANIYGNYAADVPDAYAPLEKRLADASAPDAPAEKKLELTKKQVNIGVGLLVMDQGTQVWPLLKHSPEPTLRSFLIERMGPGGVDARLLLARLDEEKDTSIRRALLLSLGDYGLDRLPLAERQNLLPRMLDLYRIDPDPGIHVAVRWLLKQWKAEEKIKEIDEASRVASAPGVKRSWSVNGQGHTMVLIPKPREGVFWLGEFKERRQQPMGYNFVISSDDVTVEQFQRFREEYKPPEQYAPTKDCPAIEVSWYDAAEYCNSLSQREGIAEAQWCYEIKQGAVPALAASAVGLLASPLGPRPLLASALMFPEDQTKIKAGYLGLQGYRLPTEVEWEYACRAGSTVGYSFGEPAELLERYGWFDRNSLGQAHPGGMLKPNDLGLFDVHGNVWQWTQDVYNEKLADNADDRGEVVAARASSRVGRGGCWFLGAGSCRAAFRGWYTPVSRFNGIGFRLARVPVEAGGK